MQKERHAFTEGKKRRAAVKADAQGQTHRNECNSRSRRRRGRKHKRRLKKNISVVEGEERYKWRNLDEEVLPWVDRRAACCGSEKMTAEKTKHKTEARIGEKRFCSNCVPYHGGQNYYQPVFFTGFPLSKNFSDQ